MARVKGSNIHKNRRNKVLKEAKGYFGSKHRLYKTAKEQVMHSGKYAFRDRRAKKRDFRKLWIVRINAACETNGISYSKFMHGLKLAEVTVNRKMLSELAIDNPKSFSDLVELAKMALEGKAPEVKKVKPKKKEVKEEKITKTLADNKEVKKETKIAKETKKNTKEENNDLSKMTVAELKELAKSKGIEGYTTMKKAELLDVLK